MARPEHVEQNEGRQAGQSGQQSCILLNNCYKVLKDQGLRCLPCSSQCGTNKDKTDACHCIANASSNQHALHLFVDELFSSQWLRHSILSISHV